MENLWKTINEFYIYLETNKKEIKSKIPDHAYSTWVDPIKLVGFNDNVLSLEVPNQFFLIGYNSLPQLLMSTFSNLSNLNIDINIQFHQFKN